MFPKYKNEELVQFRKRRDQVLKQRQREKREQATSLPLPLLHDHDHNNNSSNGYGNGNGNGNGYDENRLISSLSIMTDIRSPISGVNSSGATSRGSYGNGSGSGNSNVTSVGTSINSSPINGSSVTTSRVTIDYGAPGLDRVRPLPFTPTLSSTTTTSSAAPPIPPSSSRIGVGLHDDIHDNGSVGNGNGMYVAMHTLDSKRQVSRPTKYPADDDDDGSNDNDDDMGLTINTGMHTNKHHTNGGDELREPLLSPMSIHAAAMINNDALQKSASRNGIAHGHSRNHIASDTTPNNDNNDSNDNGDGRDRSSSTASSYVEVSAEDSEGAITDRGLSDIECDHRRALYHTWTYDTKAAEFEAELTRELHKVEVFYLDMEKTLARELVALKIPASSLHVSDMRTVVQVKQGLGYLFRRLHQLLNFRTINILGLERLAEDFDTAARTDTYGARDNDGSLLRAITSHIQASALQSSTLVPDTIADTITTFAHIFEKGDMVRAKTKLTSRMIKTDYRVRDYVKLGLKIGMTFILMLWAIVELLQWILDPDSVSSEQLHPVYIPVYQGFGLVITFIWLWGLDIWIWTRYRVNYVFIFEFNPRTRLSHLQVFQEAGTVTIVFLTNLVVHFFHGHLELPWSRSVYPLTVFIFFIWKLLCPLPPASHWQSRRVLLRAFVNIIIAPFGRVTFREIFLADCLTSMVKVFVDFYFVFCYYIGTASFIEPSSYSHACTDAKWIAVPLISCLPLYWRFQQCMKRYFETRQSWPHLANAAKYALSHTVVIMAAFHPSFKGSFDTYRVFWLLSCIASSCYSCFWDFYMDWGLLRHGFNAKHPLLRDTIMYPRSWYYGAMFFNMFMRFLWLFTILPFDTNPFFVGAKWLPPVVIFVEIYRRCQWAVFRTEWQHLSDEEKLRKTQHVPVIIDNFSGSSHARKLTLKDSKVILEMFVMCALLVGIGLASAYL